MVVRVYGVSVHSNPLLNLGPSQSETVSGKVGNDDILTQKVYGELVTLASLGKM